MGLEAAFIIKVLLKSLNISKMKIKNRRFGASVYLFIYLLSGDAHARRPLHKIHGVFFFFFVFYVSCWNIRFRAICHFRPTNSASSGENLSNRVHLFRQL